MAGAVPSINLPVPPGGHLFVSEAGLPEGTNPGGASTQSSWTFTVSSPDGIENLTVGGYAAIRGGVFTPGSVDLGFAVLSVTGFEPGNGSVSVNYRLTGPIDSGGGSQTRYGTILGYEVVLEDPDGDRAEADLVVQIRDDEAVALSPDAAAAAAGGTASGNLVADGTADSFTADGFGGITRIGDASGGAWDATPDASGRLVFEGAYGTLSVNAAGDYSYAARADAPAGAVDRLTYWAQDGDGDERMSWLEVTIREGGGSAPTGGDGQAITADGPYATLSGGAGNDTLTASAGGDTITAGDGADVIVLPSEPWAPHVVADFALGTDRLDFPALEAAYGGADPVADGFVWFLDDGAGGTKLLFDRDGAADGQEWPNYVLHLQGVSADGLTWDALAGGGGSAPAEPDPGPDPEPPAAGGELIVSPGPGSTLTGGAGNDTLVSSRGEDVLSGGAGADRFVFEAENWAPARIADFEPGADVIDLRGMLDAIGYAGTDPFADGHLRLIEDGAGGTKVLFDRDAEGPDPVWANYVFQVEHVAPAALGASAWIFQ